MWLSKTLLHQHADADTDTANSIEQGRAGKQEDWLATSAPLPSPIHTYF